MDICQQYEIVSGPRKGVEVKVKNVKKMFFVLVKQLFWPINGNGVDGSSGCYNSMCTNKSLMYELFSWTNLLKNLSLLWSLYSTHYKYAHPREMICVSFVH